MNYMHKLNEQLSVFTNITILEISGKKALLSNGKVIEGIPEVRKLKRRIANNSYEYLVRFDKIYSTDADESTNAENEAKQATSRKGGIAVQEKYGEKIKKNLNTGIPWNKDLSGNYPHKPWSKGKTKYNNKSLAKLSNDRAGEGNPMYGKQVSTETRALKSEIMKNKILSGSFTPNSNNRNTHWESEYNGKKYRSSWEALCQHEYPGALYETLRIEYNHEHQTKVYIVDFVDHTNKVAIEVKPVEIQTGLLYNNKIKALRNWCDINGYDVVIYDQERIKQVTLSEDDRMLFDKDTLRKLKAII